MDESLIDVQKQLRSWREKMQDWRDEAIEHYNLVAGRQYDDDEQTAHEDANRPLSAFNRISALVRGVCGLEVNNRQEVRYLPREIGDVQVNEVLTAAAKWVRDECNAEDEESEAFRDLLVCGIGATETWMDYSEDPAGMLRVDRLDPLSCAWDATAKKRGLQDARWVATWKDSDPAEVERKWPGATEGMDEEEDTFDDALDDATQPHSNDQAPWYRSGVMGESKRPRKIRVVQYQYWREITFFRVFGMQGQHMDLPSKQFEQARPMIEGRGLHVRKMKGREYRQRFYAGNKELSDETLNTEKEGFTIKFMTGMRDRNKGHWYGLVRDMKDPQKWTNKFFSLIVDILGTNAKGGLLAEQGAFLDDKQAEENWADPRAIVWLKPGGMAKIRERTSNAVPPALAQLMDMANNMVPQTSGVSLEFLGLTDRVQPGVVEYQRRQSTIGTLAEFFSSLRLYRKNQGRVMAQMIRAYLNDGRLIRVMGGNSEQYIPLLLQPGALDYDVVVDEAPSSPDIKGRAWAALGEVLPLVLKQGLPIPPEVLDYSPLPSTLVAKWKEMLENVAAQPQIPPELEKQVAQMGEEMQRLVQENQQLKADRSAKMAEMEAKREDMAAKLNMEAEGTAVRLKLEEEQKAFERKMRLEDMLFEQQIRTNELQMNRMVKTDEMTLKLHESEQNRRDKVADIEVKRQERQQQREIEDSGVKEAIADLKALVASLGKEDTTPVAFTFSYDKQGRVTGAKGGKKSLSFGRDKEGRIKTAKVVKTATGE